MGLSSVEAVPGIVLEGWFKPQQSETTFNLSGKAGEQTLYLNHVVLVWLTEGAADSRPQINSYSITLLLLLLLENALEARPANKSQQL